MRRDAGMFKNSSDHLPGKQYTSEEKSYIIGDSRSFGKEKEERRKLR